MRIGRFAPAKRNRRSQVRLTPSEGSAAPQAGLATTAEGVLAARVPAVILLAGALWLLVRLLSGARFEVRQVEIRGLHHLATEQVAELVDVAGRSIFLVRAQVLAHGILARYGCIEAVDVRCRLPDQVTVTVREKDVALVWQSGERYWWLGPDAEVLGETDDPGDLVVLRDVEGRAPDPGTYVPGVPVALAQDLGTVLSTNRRYDYTAEAGLVVYVTAEGWPVYLGHEGDAARKVAIMRSLVDSLVSRRASVAYIDLRNERRPTYKPG